MTQLHTGFLSGPSGSLHISLFCSPPALHSSRWVIQVPAFGEEMNKSRGMVARQARALADQGVTVLVPDLFGTGDSAGSLQDVTWQAWLDDIAYLVKWVRGQGAAHITLWGHRAGCLLAAEVFHFLDKPPDQVIFWQPVHSGKLHLAQFLRLRMAAGLASKGTDTVVNLRERILQSERIEVAGYILPSGLFRKMEEVELSQLTFPVNFGLGVFEVVIEAGRPVLPVTAKLVKQWREMGVDCSVETAIGDPFWMTQELAFSQDLINKTTAYLMKKYGASSGPPNGEADSVNKTYLPLAAVSADLTKAITFNCEQEQLAGILHQSSENASRGVVIIVGGPQYRAGSHRQFVHLARHLAALDIPTLRFDYRGMGDSSGELQGFEAIELDIRSAVDALQLENPQVKEVVLWGLCDAATAAVFYAAKDARINALILANPWVYSSQGSAKAYLKYYYLQRLLTREFWNKVLSGHFQVFASISSIWRMLKGARANSRATEEACLDEAVGGDRIVDSQEGLVPRFADALSKFSGNVFFIFSGNDLTAAEFVDASRSNRPLRQSLKCSNVRKFDLPNVDHTFSRESWRSEVEKLTAKILQRKF